MADLHRRRLDGEKSGRGLLAFRCRKSLDFSKVAETSVLGTRKRESAEEEDVSPQRKGAELPEKYAILEAFYEGVEAAVGLLGVRLELSTFQAVCALVEASTKRRFLQKHLAQIKWVLPEAVFLEYVRSYDADTRSNKWELKISLLPLPAEAEEFAAEESNAAKKPKSESVQRRRAFRARLVKFAATHFEEDDVPAHPMPERMFTGSTPLTSISTIPVVTTCIPLEINRGSHRVDVPKCSPAQSSHFSKSFSSCFSLKPGSSFVQSAKKAAPASPDSILPMPINRTSHRDIHDASETTSGSTQHLAPSFKPFFSVKQTTPEPEQGLTPIVAGIPVTPSKRSREIVEEPVELQTPIKIIRTTIAPEFDSLFKKPQASSTPSTPVKPSMSKEVSWDVRTPGRTTSDQDDDCKTPVKSFIPVNPFKSPAPVTPKHHQHTPCTPEVTAESCLETSSLHHEAGFKSPAATPLKQGSAMRSLFGTPKSSAGGESPGMDVPSTPVNPARSSRLRSGKEEAKQSLFGDGGAPPSWRKTLSFANEVSEIDI